LQAKLGPSHVHKLQLGDDPRPEKRSRYVHPNVHPATTTTEPLRRAELRPSLLLPEPQPLCEAVSLIHGPERIATGWWDGHNMIRDYFIARTEQGRWLWVFRTPEQQWFIHGQFS
ncbi:MAG: DNA polymerase Y family protein, partial [Vibrio fluvialis]